MLTNTNNKLYAKQTLKKLILLVGLVLVLLFVFEQTSNDYDYQGSGSSKVSMLQLDKDHRDIEEAVLTFKVLGHGLLLLTVVFIVYSLLYQEPTLLVHPRPPNH
jgi:hypothetical protein